MSFELHVDRVRLPIPVDFPSRFKGKRIKKRSQLAKFLNWLMFATKSSGAVIAKELGVHEATVYRMMTRGTPDHRNLILLADMLTNLTGLEFTFEQVQSLNSEHDGSMWHKVALQVQETFMETQGAKQ